MSPPSKGTHANLIALLDQKPCCTQYLRVHSVNICLVAARAGSHEERSYCGAVPCTAYKTAASAWKVAHACYVQAVVIHSAAYPALCVTHPKPFCLLLCYRCEDALL